MSEQSAQEERSEAWEASEAIVNLISAVVEMKTHRHRTMPHVRESLFQKAVECQLAAALALERLVASHGTELIDLLAESVPKAISESIKASNKVLAKEGFLHTHIEGDNR